MRISSKLMNSLRSHVKSGFSLVEVCLALAVVGIGLLGVFSLFPAGLQMNKRNTDATVSTMFAEDVFNVMHALIDSDPEQWQLSLANWATNEVPITARTMWDNEEGEDKVSFSGGTVKYITGTGQNEIEHIALRYRCQFFEDEYSDDVRWARLAVWNGEFGPLNENNAYVFTTAFYNYGM